MSLMPRLTGPAFSPADMGYALTERDVGRLEYWGAAVGQGFDQSLAGIGIRDLPPLLNTPGRIDSFIDERLQELQALHPNREILPAELETLRLNFQREAEQQLQQYTPITQEQWRASPSFREAVPYEDGMTVERATGLAEQYDEQAYREWLMANHDADWFSVGGAFIAGIVGGAASPEVFVPVVGPGMRAALAARLGVVGGRAAVGAIEGTIGTAAVLPFISEDLALIGRELTPDEMLLDVAFGALGGAAIGAGSGVLARRGEARRTALQARQEIVLTDARVAGEALAKVELAQRQIEAGTRVEIPEASRASVDAMLQGLSIQERHRFLSARQDQAVNDAETLLRRIIAEDEGVAVPRRTQATLTALENNAVRGATPDLRRAAQERLDAEREQRVAQRRQEPGRLARDTIEAARAVDEPARLTDDAVAAELRRRGVAPEGLRRQVPELTKLERMALFDRSPRVRQAARAEIDRRLGQDGTTTARPFARPTRPGNGRPTAERQAPQDSAAARTPDTGDPAADIDVSAEIRSVMEDQGIAQDRTFPELDDWKRMDAAGELTPEERASFAAAEEAVAKTERARETYLEAASCLLRLT